MFRLTTIWSFPIWSLRTDLFAFLIDDDADDFTTLNACSDNLQTQSYLCLQQPQEPRCRLLSPLTFPQLLCKGVMMIVWRVTGNIIRSALCWIVWHNDHSQQHTYMSSSHRSNRLGLSHWDPCVEAVAYSSIIVTWWSGFGEIQAWSRWLTGLIVPEMTYNVLSGTLSNQPTCAIRGHPKNRLVWVIQHPT